MICLPRTFPNPNLAGIRPAALEPVTMCARMRIAIVDQGNPRDWHGTLANATATTFGRANDAVVFFFHGLLRRAGHIQICIRSTDDVGGFPWMCVTPLSTIRLALADLTTCVTDG